MGIVDDLYNTTELQNVGTRSLMGALQAGPGEVSVTLISGGAEEDRTPDLRIANATLSQLSYGPIPVSIESNICDEKSVCAEPPLPWAAKLRHMALPNLSIIIPTINEAERLPGLVEAISHCRASHCEIVVSDGGSSDNTVAVASALGAKVVQSTPGRGTQLGQGVAAAQGDWYLFLHADSAFDGRHLSALLEAIKCHPEPSWGWFQIRIADEALAFRMIETMMNWRSRTTQVATGDQGMFAHRAVFERAGGFIDEPLMEDVALSKSLRRIAKPLIIEAPKIGTSSRRWLKHGVFRTVVLMWWLRAAYFFGVEPKTLVSWYRRHDT